MKKVIRLTESDIMRIVRKVINEQGFMFNVGNSYFGNVVSKSGVKSTNQHLKIEEVDNITDTVTVINLSNPVDNMITGVKDLKLDSSGNTYKRTDGKGYFTLVKKRDRL